MAGNTQQPGIREQIREQIPPVMLSFVAGAGASAGVDHFLNEVAVNFKDGAIVGGEAALVYIAGRILSATNFFNRFPIATKVGGISGLLTAGVSTAVGVENPLILPISIGASVLTGVVGEVIHRNRHEIRSGFTDLMDRNRAASEERKARKAALPPREPPKKPVKSKPVPIRPTLSAVGPKPEQKHLNLMETECLEFGEFFLANMSMDRLIQDFSEQLERTPNARIEKLIPAIVNTPQEQQIWQDALETRFTELRKANPQWSLAEIFNELGWQTIDLFDQFYQANRDLDQDGFPVPITPVNKEMKKRRTAAIRQNSTLSEQEGKILLGSESITALDSMQLAIQRINEKFDIALQSAETSEDTQALVEQEEEEMLNVKGTTLNRLRLMYSRA